MPLRRKIAVLSVIGFGASAVLIAMLRFIILKRLGTDPDISYVLGEMIIVAALEIEFAVIAVNLPPMKSLWNKLTGGPTSTSGGDGYSGAKAYKFQRSGGSYGRPKLGSNTDHMELTSIDSEKELYGRAQNDNDIKITTKVAVTSAARADSDNDQGTSNSTFYAPERV